MREAVPGKVILGSLLILLTLGGCSSREDRDLFGELARRSGELRQLQQTQKVILPADKDRETLTLLVRYLPRISRLRHSEVFLVALYPETPLALQLEGTSPRRISTCDSLALSENERAGIPDWFTLHCVEFPQLSQKRLRLSLTTPWGTRRELLFSKVPKYLITKPKF